MQPPRLINGSQGVLSPLWRRRVVGIRSRQTMHPPYCISVPRRQVHSLRPFQKKGNERLWRVVLVRAQSGSNQLVRFRTRKKLGPFEFFKITGGVDCLGDWDRSKAPRMIPYGEDVWELDIMVPRNFELSFTCVVNGEHGEDGEQVTRSVMVKECERLEVDFDFGNESSMHLTEIGGNGETPRAPVVEGLANKWEGKSIQFMESNDHPRDREGNWSVDGLQGLERQLVSEDEKAGSWLQKLNVAEKILVDGSTDKRPGLEAVALCHIYLSWIGQGVIQCVESGGHRRPNHHAQAAMVLFRSLEWVIEPGRRRKELVWMARRLQTKLPSFSSEYRNSEPLTRIRDIAHRNDIPKQMKNEIKHTIQNKLHRNAGPEDLVASELMYERILQDKDNLSSDFVHQFGVFLAELRDFFNAGTLTQLLQKIGPSLTSNFEDNHAVERFISLQKNLDSAGTQTLGPAEQANKIIETLHAATTVRAMICSKLQSGLRNDAPDTALSMRQCYRLAEVRTEEYAFVLMSRFVNLLEKTGGLDNLETAGDQSWALPIGALVLGIRHVGMDGWDSAECMALENELSSWQKEGNLIESINALRMKSTMERLQRLTESFCDSVLEILAPKAQALGSGLGVTGHNATVFAESEIRSSIVFQLSKLCAYLLQSTRKASGQSSWDMLVPGEATGKLVSVENLESYSNPGNSTENVVLLVRRADGDEDVAHLVAKRESGSRVTGVILCQELPHLSHLGVRARQEKLVFAACWDEAVLDQDVRALTGKHVKLEVGVGGVVLREHHGADQIEASIDEDLKQTSSVSFASAPSIISADKLVLPQADATVDNCGAKAGNCGLLDKMSTKSGAFCVPAGVCLPFGSMTHFWDDETKDAVKDSLEKLNDMLSLGSPSDELDSAVKVLQDLIISVGPSDDVLASIASSFKSNSRVIVRSSSNMEDMAGMSGAGLHDSLANIDPHSPSDLSAAIARVWASLHTKRALQSRHAAGIAHTDAEMGILIQEQLFPDVSFVLHTTDPISKNKNLLQAEVAPGVGETLASGARGTPWRFSVNKKTAESETQAFANFSEILMPNGVKSKGKWIKVDEFSGLVYKTADYSIQPLSFEADTRDLISRRLVEVGTLLEAEFNDQAQDVEGAMVGNDMYIVQSRPQPL